MKNPNVRFFVIGFCSCFAILTFLFFYFKKPVTDTSGVYLGRIQMMKKELIESEKIKAALRIQIKLSEDSLQAYQDSSLIAIKPHVHEINRILYLHADSAIALSAKWLSIPSHN